MKKKITKDMPEFQMFQEFWKLRQEYHDPEDTEEFWDAAIKDVSAFISKYKNTDVAWMAEKMGSLILDDAERRHKGGAHNG